MNKSSVSNSSDLSGVHEVPDQKYPLFEGEMYQPLHPPEKENCVSPRYNRMTNSKKKADFQPISALDAEQMDLSFQTDGNQSVQTFQAKKDQVILDSVKDLKNRQMKASMKYDDIGQATSMTIPQNFLNKDKSVAKAAKYPELRGEMREEPKIPGGKVPSVFQKEERGGEEEKVNGSPADALDDDDMDLSFRTQTNQSVQASQARKDEVVKEWGTDFKKSMKYDDIGLATSMVVPQESINKDKNPPKVANLPVVSESGEIKMKESENNYDLLNGNIEVKQASARYQSVPSNQQQQENKQHEMTDLLDTVKTARQLTEPSILHESFVDEKMLYHIHDAISMSKHRGVQTDKKEHKEQRPEFLSNAVAIKILSETRVKEGALSKAYYTYKIQTILQGEGKGEYTVTRRYRDFDWLFERLSTKYQGYVIPVLPPKSIYISLQIESNEFHENRKRELVRFLEKCMQHTFLRTTEELDMFLTDQTGFSNLKDTADQGSSWWDTNFLSNILDKVNNIAKGEQPVLRELSGTDSELINHEVMFAGLMTRLEAFSKDLDTYLKSKIQNIKTTSSFALGLENIRIKREDIQENKRQVTSLYTKNADIQKGYAMEMLEKTKTDLKDIIISVESVNVALKRRNDRIKELYKLQQIVEARSVKAKKSLTSNEKLDDLKGECDNWKEDLKKFSNTLLEEINSEKDAISEQLSQFSQTIFELDKQCLQQALGVWEAKKTK